jgi:hypothetical protein
MLWLGFHLVMSGHRVQRWWGKIVDEWNSFIKKLLIKKK